VKRRKHTAKTRIPGAAPRTPASDLLERLSPEEAVAVMRLLLDKHPELRREAEGLAIKHASSRSIADVAQDVHDRITGIDLDALNGRAGRHSWGYVEPAQAAIDLLAEALDDLAEDMKRKAQLALVPAAAALHEAS